MLLLLLIFDRICINAQALQQKNHRQLAKTDCNGFATRTVYQIYNNGQFDSTCYDENPDAAQYPYSAVMYFSDYPNGKVSVLFSKDLNCQPQCYGCFTFGSSDCMNCSNRKRGKFPKYNDIMAKTPQSCNCITGYVGQDCACPEGYYEQTPSDTTLEWSCKACPFLFLKCYYTSEVLPQKCKTGVGRKTDPNTKCVCDTGYKEYSPVQADCSPECEKPCSLCQSGSNKLCSQCFDSKMIFDSSAFTCTCPTSFYMSSTDFMCYACHFTCQTCNGGSNANNCLSCRTTRKLDSSSNCACDADFKEASPVSADCIPDCDKPCSKCYPGSNKKCSQCFDSMMILDNATYTCNCPTQYYMDPTDFKCYACHYTCQTCNGPSNANCLSCITSSQRLLQSGQCNCPPHYVISSQLNCVQCQWSCDTCNSINSCLTCFQGDNRIVGGASNYCVCKSGFAEDLISSTCVTCHYTCLTCGTYFDVCTSCPINSMRQLMNYSCQCQDYYYDTEDQACSQCDLTCQQCDGPYNNNCINCDASSYRYLNSQKQCICMDGYGYIDLQTLQCQSCNYLCLTCDQINQCLTCPQNSFRILDENNQCSCDIGYYDYQSQLQCQKCHFSCSTCNGQGPDKCLSCNYDLGRVLNDTYCKCSQGFYDFQSICIPCFYQCLSCINQFQNGCTSCPESRQLQNGQCFCKDLAQIDDGQSLECSNCHYTCQTCFGIDSNNCLTCYDNSNNLLTVSREIQYGICSCPKYWFDDGQNEACQQCHPSCLSCFNTSDSGCVTCEELDFREQQSNSCYCMDGYFEDQQQNCSKCDYRCETCVSDKTNCLGCPLGSLRVLIVQNNSSGYNTCACTPAQPNDIQDNPICQPCHFSCSNCTDPSINHCTICSDAYNRQLSTDSNGSFCLCKTSYYEIGNSECASCSSLCFNCKTTATNCTECDPNLFRVLSGNTCICATRFGTKQLSYYDNLLDPECVACHYSCYTCYGVEYNQCSTCSDLDFRYQQGSECLCKPKYIDNREPQCMGCNYSCDTCEGTKYNCTSCPSGSLRSLNVQSQQCECPLGYYDAGITICQKCDVICDSCSDKSTTCLSCVFGSNRVYNSLTYYCDCLSGYFDAGDGTCSICHYSCSKCTGPLITDCSQCPDFQATQRVLINNSCICSDQYYDDQTNKICQLCSPTCYTCQGNKNTCTQCFNIQNRILSGSSCACLSKYYDSGSDVCQRCSDYCLECQNLSTSCTQCDSNLNRYLKQQKCQCQDGFYDNQQLLCQQCHNSCQTCLNTSTNCTSCDKNDYREFNNGKCVCIYGALELGNKQCGICDQRCKTCSNLVNECLSCDSVNNRILVGKQCVCIAGYFENSLSQCQPCNQQCQTCLNNENYCTTCSAISHKVIGYSNNCICQNGYYTDSNNDCQICSSLCLLCQDSPTKCLSCNMNRILVNNSCQCLDGQFQSGMGCGICSYACKTCAISSDICMSCGQGSKRTLQGTQCVCQPGFYDLSSQTCFSCSIQCLTCVSDSTNCLSCDSSLFRIQNGNQCPCQPGYYDNGSALCQICDKQCATCMEQSNKCTSCNISNTYRVDQSNIYQCPCNIGFYDAQDYICRKCSYQCINCEGSATNCTLCNNNPGYYRINILPQCVCQDGYFDDGIQVFCQKCHFKCQTCILNSENCLQCENQVSRNPSPICDCTQGYYLEIQSQQCLECSMQCETCSENANKCKSCKPDRITQNCICQEGYYEANLYNCQQCSPKCKTCENHQLYCQQCALNRISPPNCICKEHYYDDYINTDCQQCDQYCGKCDFKGCIDCAANRVLDGKNCQCPADSVSYTDTPWCSNCDVAVVKGMFSDDLTSIIYKFEFPIQFYFPFQIDAQAYCEKIITQESLQLLGQSPQCVIENQNLIIKLGDGASVIVADTINFNPSFLKHPQCAAQLTKILRTDVNPPLNQIKPSIKLEYPQIAISPCSQTQIIIKNQFISGQRNLNIEWFSSIYLKEIQQANLNQFQTLSIEQGSLPENSQINITLQFTNFLNQSDILSINITTLSSNIPQFQFQGSRQQYLVWTPIKLMVYYSNKICSKSESKQVVNNIEINFEEVDLLRQPMNSNPVKFTQSQFNFIESENLLYTIIPASTLSINSNYSIQAKYKDSINNIFLTVQKDIQIQRSPLIVQIVGGSRIQNYLKEFSVQIQAKDPDFQTEWNTDQDITVEVSCMDIQRNNQPCKDIYNRTIPLNVTSFTQYIGKRLFNPFTVLIFKATCKKQSLINTEEVSIILLDTDLPSLDVKYPTGYKIRDVNINEQLQFEIQLTNNQFLKNMYFSYALVYNYETIFVKFIPNQNLKFKMWDNFINFGFANKISVRLQAHDINYLMPQTFSVQLSINMPPVMSIISIQPQLGNSFFTQFTMKVQNAKDTDSPISYRFAYYQSESLYNIDIKKAKQDNLMIIQDFSLSQTFSGILESGNLTILVSVSDSYGSTRNYSQQITSLSFIEQIQSQNITCSQFLLQFTDQVYDYKQQIILAQELIKLNNQTSDCLIQTKSLLSKLKQSLQVEMQSQTNINTQFRINNILSQLYDIDFSNERRLLQNQSENICYDINSGEIRFDTLKKINQQQESLHLRTIIDSLSSQIEKATTQNKNLLSDYQSAIDIGDEQTFRTLQQNFMWRQSLIKVLGSLYSQADQSKFLIRNLINKLIDSLQKNLELDKSGIKLVTNSIGVQTYKISQIKYQQFVMADQDGDEIQDLSTYQINRIVQMSRYSDNFYFSQQSFQDQFKNGTYMISEIDNNNSYKSKSIIPLQSQVVYDPFIYVDRDTTTIQVKKIYSGKLNFNMKQEFDQCNETQNKNTSKYSIVCSTYDGDWKFNQCQLDQQINKRGKVVFLCLCKMLNPITLMIINETKYNKTNTTQINRTIDIEDIIDVSLRYNTYNIIILAILITLIIIIIVYQIFNRIALTNNIMIELERLTSEQTLTLTQQPQFSKEILKKNQKYLHEISRVVTTRYKYLSQQARILLIMFNISVPLTTLNIFVTILGGYFISFSISVIVGLLFQIITKILEGFFTGPKILRIFGYIVIILLNLGLLTLNSFINRFNHYLIFDISSAIVLLIILYGPLEILIQYMRLSMGFEKYKELKSDPMNPILNFIYYFLQDEVIICIVKGAIIC